MADQRNAALNLQNKRGVPDPMLRQPLLMAAIQSKIGQHVELVGDWLAGGGGRAAHRSDCCVLCAAPKQWSPMVVVPPLTCRDHALTCFVSHVMFPPFPPPPAAAEQRSGGCRGAEAADLGGPGAGPAAAGGVRAGAGA
jgi:hypothetical protein